VPHLIRVRLLNNQMPTLVKILSYPMFPLPILNEPAAGLAVCALAADVAGQLAHADTRAPQPDSGHATARHSTRRPRAATACR